MRSGFRVLLGMLGVMLTGLAAWLLMPLSGLHSATVIVSIVFATRCFDDAFRR